jgi:isomerase DpgB
MIGLGPARRMIVTGDALNASQAQQLGLIDQVEPDTTAIAAWIQKLSPVNPVAVALSRRLMLEAYSTPFEDAIGNFLAAQHRAISQSAFLNTLRKEQKQ